MVTITQPRPVVAREYDQGVFVELVFLQGVEDEADRRVDQEELVSQPLAHNIVGPEPNQSRAETGPALR